MVYLTEVEASLLEQSSERDRALYSLLNGVKPDIEVFETDSDESRMWKTSFTNIGDLEVLNKLRAVRPFKGLHYSSNLVLLIAAARIDFSGEKENIQTYLASHSQKELIIINKALSQNFSEDAGEITHIDSLARKLCSNDLIEEEDISRCFSSIKDVYDLFIVKLGCAALCCQFSERENLPRYKTLVSLGNSVINRINLIIYVVLISILAATIYSITPLVKSFIVNWDTWEPIVFIVEIVIALSAVVVGVRVKVVKKWLNRIVLSSVYKLIGIDYKDYCENYDKVFGEK